MTTASRRLVLMGLVLAGACACTQHVQDPWVSGNQYAQERHRSAAQQDALRQRLFTVQQDR
jgi:hypothetical protein